MSPQWAFWHVRQWQTSYCVRAWAQVFKRVGNSAIRLLLVPGIIEAFFDGGIAIAIFGMPPLFAFALGFILKAVGPALVIQCMFEVQQKRLGTLECAPPCTCIMSSGSQCKASASLHEL